jgi:hypothetical protein
MSGIRADLFTYTLKQLRYGAAEEELNNALSTQQMQRCLKS